MEIEQKFKDLFNLVRKKSHNPDEVISKIQYARILMSERITEKTEPEIRREVQEHKDLMKLLCEITQVCDIQQTTVRLLIAQAVGENGNGQKHS